MKKFKKAKSTFFCKNNFGDAAEHVLAKTLFLYLDEEIREKNVILLFLYRWRK